MLQFYKIISAGTAEKEMESLLDFLSCSKRPVNLLFRLMCLVALRHFKPSYRRIYLYKSPPPSLQRRRPIVVVGCCVQEKEPSPPICLPAKCLLRASVTLMCGRVPHNVTTQTSLAHPDNCCSQSSCLKNKGFKYVTHELPMT